MEEYRLDAEFERNARFVLPDVSGPLLGRVWHKPGEGPGASILGADLPGMFNRALTGWDVVHGQMLGGRRFTLIGCTALRSSLGMGITAEAVIAANALVFDTLVPEPLTQEFLGIDVSGPDLEHFLAYTTVLGGHFDGSQTTQEVTLRTHRPVEIGFSPLSGGPSLVLEYHRSTRRQSLSTCEIKNVPVLRIIPRTPRTIDGLEAELEKAVALLSLLAGMRIFPAHLAIRTPDEERQGRVKSVPYLPRRSRPLDTQRATRRLPFIGHAEIEPFLASLWSKWNERYDDYQTALELVAAAQVHSGQLLEFQFLSLMQAIETIHRARMPGTYVSPEEYEVLRMTLDSSIPRETPHDLKQALRRRLEFGNEPSLRRRLRELVRAVEAPVLDAIHPQLQTSIDVLIDNRNHLTHFSSAPGFKPLSHQGIYVAVRVLRGLLSAYLLSDAGLPPSILAQAFSKSADYAFIRGRKLD